MSGALTLRNILTAFPAVLLIAHIYLALRLGSDRISRPAAYRYARFLSAGWGLVIVGAAFAIIAGRTSWLSGLIILISAGYLLRAGLRIAGVLAPGAAPQGVRLPAMVMPAASLTPDAVERVLTNPSVIATLKADLGRTGQLGYKETWRLGLIVPGRDEYRPGPSPLGRGERLAKYASDPNYRANLLETVPLARSAALYQPASFGQQFDRLTVWGGERKPQAPGYPGWTYTLATQPQPGQYLPIRQFKIDTTGPFTSDRSPQLAAFLREEGFPLRGAYEDGDPFTADRGGTVVLDKGRAAVIYPRYFVHRRLIDDRGDLVDIGLDEGPAAQALVGVQMRPGVSQGLLKTVNAAAYTPVVRYRAVPYASDYLVPLLDTPMSMNGWADLYIDTRGKGKLFVARENSPAEWFEMLAKLQKLLMAALERHDCRLLSLTQDKPALNDYLAAKLAILGEYFVVREWTLP